jgi:hypothetical protein
VRRRGGLARHAQSDIQCPYFGRSGTFSVESFEAKDVLTVPGIELVLNTIEESKDVAPRCVEKNGARRLWLVAVGPSGAPSVAPITLSSSSSLECASGDNDYDNSWEIQHVLSPAGDLDVQRKSGSLDADLLGKHHLIFP